MPKDDDTLSTVLETDPQEKPKVDKKAALAKGIGLDIGTMNIVSARRSSKGVETTRMRDVFLGLEKAKVRHLKLTSASYVERDDEVFLLGDAAMEMANVFGEEPRRPLSAGLISPKEVDALDVLKLLIEKVLGKPRVEGEHCYFSVPAAPIDQPDRDIVYHKGIFERIVSECGYTATPGNEAMAIIYSECANDGFSGLSMSFGSGMTNIALAINTIEGLSFAVARSGDYIDQGAAKSTGSTQARICAIKEAGIDLRDPQGREQEAIVFYYKDAISYVLDKISLKFREIEGQFALPKPIPLVVSGGTSLATGFMEVFESVFEKKRKRFPVEISEIRHASDPLNAVAVGMLVQAMQEYEG